MSEPRDPEKLKNKLRVFAQSFGFFRMIGFDPTDFGPKWAKCQLTIRPELHNPNGVLHGGVIAAFIDASITQALLMTDEYQVVRDTRGSLSTIDLHIKYLRPVRDGVLRCEANIVHLGKRVIHAQARVRSADDKDIALGDASMMIVPGNS